MYQVGQEEIDAIARVIRSGALFRYGIGGECDRFEERYAAYLGSPHVTLTCSGTYALTAAVIAAGIGPGDEVLVPAHTYMATAMAVLAAGAIPVIVDVDDTITIDPAALENAIGPRTKAAIPVHMWGAACDMNRIMEIARRKDILVIEDTCQGIGGGYEGAKLGTIGHLGAFSFNYYKNMSAGEGGAVCTADADLDARVKCAIDPCHYYWTGRGEDSKPFAGNSGRASEIMAAMLNVQLDRLPGMIAAMRDERRRVLKGTAGLANLGLTPTRANSPNYDCATQIMYSFPDAATAARFTALMPSVVAGKTGRHTYTEWDQVLTREGAAHAQMNPYQMAANQGCRMEYSKDMCRPSLEILDKTVMIATDPARDEAATDRLIANINAAARVVFGELALEDAHFEESAAVDTQKFNIPDEPAVAG